MQGLLDFEQGFWVPKGEEVLEAPHPELGVKCEKPLNGALCLRQSPCARRVQCKRRKRMREGRTVSDGLFSPDQTFVVVAEVEFRKSTAVPSRPKAD